MPDVAKAILEFIDGVLPKTHATPEIAELYRMMRDYPWRGGKMIRSRLLLAMCEAFSGRFQDALPLAAALELFQNWVLIHDDIEDDSDERRGKPALHRIHGMPLALNAGDALHVYMWQVVHGSGVQGAFAAFLEMIHRTAEGQQLDLAWVEQKRFDLTTEDYFQLVHLKTAYYTVVAPLHLGMLAAGVKPNPVFVQAGLDLGAAFQIRDDVLNLIADFKEYGKEIAGDLLEGKRTLMLLHLLEHASETVKNRVIDILGQPRTAKSVEDVQWILQQMQVLESIPFAQNQADLLATRGLALLEKGLQSAPNQQAAQLILETARSLATRVA